MKAVVVAFDAATACGAGLAEAWPAIRDGRRAFSELTRFPAGHLASRLAATAAGLNPRARDSLAMQLLRPLLARLRPAIPADALLLLATTAGEVDRLERHVLLGQGDPEASRPDRLLARVKRLCGVRAGRLVSAACASSSTALALGAGLIETGRREAVVVVACDAVTEFVHAGFSALMALDPDGARPFDRDRRGLTVGEAAGVAVLLREDRAAREGRPRLGTVAGWGLASDANHMTGPSRDGDGLACAIEAALRRASAGPEAVGSICAHGTGTPYNDAMEMRAFGRVFARPAPVYSVKGAIGHTMGAAGLVEAAVALTAMKAGVAPATAGLRTAAPEAAGWVAPEPVPLPPGRLALSTNSGFGGVNAALVLGP